MPYPNPLSPHSYTPPSTHTLGLNFAVDPCDRLSHQCHPSRQPIRVCVSTRSGCVTSWLG